MTERVWVTTTCRCGKTFGRTVHPAFAEHRGPLGRTLAESTACKACEWDAFRGLDICPERTETDDIPCGLGYRHTGSCEPAWTREEHRAAVIEAMKKQEPT